MIKDDFGYCCRCYGVSNLSVCDEHFLTFCSDCGLCVECRNNVIEETAHPAINNTPHKGKLMNKEQFKKLKTGDIVRHKAERGKAYVVHDNYGDRVTAARTVDITNPGEWDLVAECQREQSWLSVEEFQLEANEGECFIAFKDRVVMAYHNHKGYFLFSKNSTNCYMAECITKVKLIKYPDKPD